VGGASLPGGNESIVRFDTGLDGAFGDTVFTAAGGNAFSPGLSGAFVFGMVGEVSAADLTDSVTAFSTTPASYTFTRELKTLGSLGFRAGYGGGRLLAYGTGSLAYGDLEHTFTTSNRVNTFVPTDDAGAWGWRAGGGVELRVSRLSFGAEYMFTSLDDAARYTVRSQGPAPVTNPFIRANPAGTDLQRSDDLELHTVRFTASYRF
jgi:outer membrane immunogenic protein